MFWNTCGHAHPPSSSPRPSADSLARLPTCPSSSLLCHRLCAFSGLERINDSGELSLAIQLALQGERRRRARPSRHFAERLHPKSRRGWPAPILTSSRMCCLGADIALLWRFRELPEDLASYGPLPGLLSAAASLHISCSVVALLLCVVAFSSLLPFCCNHFTLCPFLWSLPPLFYL